MCGLLRGSITFAVVDRWSPHARQAAACIQFVLAHVVHSHSGMVVRPWALRSSARCWFRTDQRRTSAVVGVLWRDGRVAGSRKEGGTIGGGLLCHGCSASVCGALLVVAGTWLVACRACGRSRPGSGGGSGGKYLFKGVCAVPPCGRHVACFARRAALAEQPLWCWAHLWRRRSAGKGWSLRPWHCVGAVAVDLVR